MASMASTGQQLLLASAAAAVREDHVVPYLLSGEFNFKLSDALVSVPAGALNAYLNSSSSSSSRRSLEFIKQLAIASSSGGSGAFVLLSCFFITAVLLGLLLLLWRSASVRQQLPPGPRGHWLFGSLFQMVPSTDAAVERWSREYGPVFTAWLGFLPTIFVTGSAEARELLVKRGAAFASRPRRRSRILLTNDHRNVNTSPYGPRWRALRKNLVTGVLSARSLAAAEPMRAMHIDRLVSKLATHAKERPQEPVPVQDNVLFVVFSILLQLCFGQSFEEERVILFRESMKATLPLAGPNLGDYLPLLHLLINPGHYRRCKAVRARVTSIMLPLIRQHRHKFEHRRQVSGPAGSDEADYVDSLLAAQEREPELLNLDDDEMLLLCNELLNGGTDTSANTLEFAMAELVRLPELQARLADQIRDVCGEAKLRPEDVARLPLLRAVVLETLRLHPPGNYTLVHAASDPAGASFCGFRVPASAEILVSLKAVAMDPDTWTQPERFHPDRFLAPEELDLLLPVDITGARGGKLSLIPFGAGRRICPGINLAMVHLHLILGRLVQEFHWLPARDDQPVDMTPLTVFTVKLRNPLHARIRPRRPGSIHDSFTFNTIQD